MASSDGIFCVKAGYWFCGPPFLPVARIPSELFTHLYAGFAEVHPDGGVAFSSGTPVPYLEQFQSFTKIVRERSPQVKTLLSIGGEGSDISSVLRDQNNRERFIQDSINRASNLGFDGLDLCWLYPSPSDNGADLASFLEEWRAAVKKDAKKGNYHDELLLTAAVFHHPIIPGTGGSFFYYPCQPIKDNLDWINVLAIDFYTPSNSPWTTGPVHAWLNRIEPSRCGSAGIGNWISNGVATRQLVLSLPFYGYEWSPTELPDKYEFFAPANPANRISIAYRTIKATVDDRRNNYETRYDRHYVATYSHNNRGSWIGYDDKRSIYRKVSEAINGKANLGGCFAWHLGGDDDNWSLSNAAFAARPPAEANPPSYAHTRGRLIWFVSSIFKYRTCHSSQILISLTLRYPQTPLSSYRRSLEYLRPHLQRIKLNKHRMLRPR